MEMKDKRVCVLGMARSGVAAAHLLSGLGARVTICDRKTREDLGDSLGELEGLGIEYALGGEPDDLPGRTDLLVLSPGIPWNAPYVQKFREHHVPVLAEIEVASRLTQGLLVAITGTNGKTTTTTLVNEIFLAAGRRSHAVGNIGFPFSFSVREGAADDVYVCECSSFQMETVDGFHPRAAALLNITEDHLNRHGTMQEYTRLKMRMFEAQTPEDAAIFNLDDPGIAGLWEQVPGHVYFFSRKREVEEGAFVRDGQVILRIGGREENVCRTEEIRIPGPHNLENALAAVVLTGVCGVPVSVIRETLRTFPGVEHRIEFVREIQGCRFINDSKGTNVDSTLRAVETMDRPTVMILGGSDKHADFLPLARAMKDKELIRGAVVLGATADQIQDALEKTGFEPVKRAASLEEAVHLAWDMVGTGNVLLSPACASFDMFRDFEQRGEIFKEIVGNLHERS